MLSIPLEAINPAKWLIAWEIEVTAGWYFWGAENAILKEESQFRVSRF